jgi:hypothetical protein
MVLKQVIIVGNGERIKAFRLTYTNQRWYIKEENGLYICTVYLPVQVWEGYELSGYPTVAAPTWPV